MSINIGPPSVEELRPRIAVIGVGGAGGNAVANMIQAEIEGVDFIVANTDAQALNNSVAEHRIQLGPDITRGPGAIPLTINAPIIIAMVGLPGMPSVSIGMNDVCAPALLAASGAATPRMSP